ncbi:Panacea domain-containing protein [Faecalibacillus intestinalis]|mgnify:FL=1|uniref:Panacea domain-containing protein n=1 Tax=Faecalibacillus intestinalis TaxID=1982626 RepID=UPI0022E33C8D|nr:type II toxin-antitoxin system antitoxin SocA domain-containing protein [Faecalibacillus intestinalis]
MSYKVEDVGKYVLEYCREKNYDIPHPKLQKILYFLQAYFVTKKGNVCFEEEIEVHKTGPVISEVSSIYNRYGGYDLLIFEKNLNLTPLNESPIELSDREIIERIVDWLSVYSSSELFDAIKNQDVWKNSIESGVVMPTEMAKYYA